MRARRLSTALLAAAIAMVGVGCERSAPAPPVERVVLISLDTLRPDHLGAYGYARPTSPGLDAIAAAGVLFEDVTAPSPWTLPSHASLLTGLNPHRHGLVSHEMTLPESVATLASLLAAEGFTTAAVVNSHNLSPLFGLHRGFQQFRYVKEIVTQREPSRSITDQAIEWLRAAAGQRVFLFVHYYDVHSDYRALPEYERQFAEPYDGPADGTTAQMVRSRVGTFTFTQADARHLVNLYDAGIRQMDDELGRLIAVLGTNDLLVITSDHGEEFLEHGGVLHGRTQFEEVVRIPLIMRGPGLPRGRRVKTTVSLIDVMPTILSLVKAPTPAGLDGSDLSPTWQGGGTELGVRYLTCEADHNNAEPDVTRAVRHRTSKLHHDRLTGQVALYDLASDPGEHTDVAASRPEVVSDLRQQLERFRALRPQPGASVTLTDDQMERLRSLGYVR